MVQWWGMKTILNVLKKYFIPHKANSYKPHFFREGSVVVVSLVIVAVFVGTFFQRVAIETTSLFADIFPQVLVELTNIDRVETAQRRLAVSPLLERAAKLKAEDMARKGYFAHTSPDGVTPWYWFQEAGYSFDYAGENLAVDFSDSVDVDRAWMNSPGHRANILNNNFTEIGIAMSKGVFEGRETTFVVQMFGRPKTVRTASKSVTPVPVNTQSGTVAGAQILPALPTPSPQPEVAQVLGVVEGNELFVTATDSANLENDPSVPATMVTETEATSADPAAGFFARMASSPTKTLNYLYALIAAIVLIGLLLMIVVKIKIQHPKNIAYGAGMLALIGLLIFVYQNFLPAGVTIL